MITTKKIDPRPYQQKAAAAIHREWDAGNKKTLVVMPTGTGKTIVFASIVNDQVEKGEHVLILAHREELLQQASDKLKMVTGLETALEKAQSSALDSDKMVVVASVQTLSKQNRLMKYPRDYFGTIIIDEAHRGMQGRDSSKATTFHRCQSVGRDRNTRPKRHEIPI